MNTFIWIIYEPANIESLKYSLVIISVSQVVDYKNKMRSRCIFLDRYTLFEYCIFLDSKLFLL